MRLNARLHAETRPSCDRLVTCHKSRTVGTLLRAVAAAKALSRVWSCGRSAQRWACCILSIYLYCPRYSPLLPPSTIPSPAPPCGITRTHSGPAWRPAKVARSPDGYVSRLGNKYTLITFDQRGRQNLSITWKKPAGQPPDLCSLGRGLRTALWPSRGWTPPWTPRKAQLLQRFPPCPGLFGYNGRRFLLRCSNAFPAIFHRPVEHAR